MSGRDDTVHDDAAAAREQEESLERLERGGLPLDAERRLQRMAQQGGAFTSDLSVPEFALARQLQLRPLAQVMGSCIYQVGYQYAGATSYRGPETYSQELTVISEAWNEARARALSRLQREAEVLEADVVVGVHIKSGRYDWAENSVEFAVFGTAVRDARASSHGHAILSDLSLQDYAMLSAAGMQPCGLVAATSCFFVVSYGQTQMMTGFMGRLAFRENQELVPYTQGVYEARESALGRLIQQLRAAGADGLVGVKIDHEIHEQEMQLGVGGRVPGLVVTFHAAGTAVRNGPVAPARAPQAVINLST
jgi:uncharacterized protein YbjQ (UPF0145 family)